MILIADSGSTKTRWCLAESGTVADDFITEGLNPCHADYERIATVVKERVAPRLGGARPAAVYFYGAGCNTSGRSALVERALREALGAAEICVESDMVGAARGLCGDSDGLVCILGTGANSCLFERGRVVRNVSPLGYILGDEGSGAVLGRILLADYLKNQLPESLAARFKADYDPDPSAVIESVYRRPLANRYLASFCPFLSRHADSDYTRELLRGEFSRFVTRNLDAYGRKDLPVHFTGSVAAAFSDALRSTLEDFGYTPGRIEAEPMPGLLRYHR